MCARNTCSVWHICVTEGGCGSKVGPGWEKGRVMVVHTRRAQAGS